MLILKSQDFDNHDLLSMFINKNGIQRENIVSITASTTAVSHNVTYCLFFYGDSEATELTKGVFGWG